MTTKKSRSIMKMLNACFLTAKVLTIAVQKSDIWVEKKNLNQSPLYKLATPQLYNRQKSSDRYGVLDWLDPPKNWFPSLSLTQKHRVSFTPVIQGALLKCEKQTHFRGNQNKWQDLTFYECFYYVVLTSFLR